MIGSRQQRRTAREGRSQAASVLIVDDDSATREALRDLLEAVGYPVAVAAHGLEALNYLRRNPVPDLILVDLMMPRMNGWVFGLEQQRDPRLAGIPIVVYSGIYDAESAARYLRAAGFLEKPVDAERLFDLLRRYCPPPSRRSPAAQPISAP